MATIKRRMNKWARDYCIEHGLDYVKVFSEYEREGFVGCDICVRTSLYEYGLIWKQIKEDEYLFIYGVSYGDAPDMDDGVGYNKFSYAYMTRADWDELFEPDSWCNVNEVASYTGLSVEEFKDHWPDEVHTMMMYYGHENIFGSSYGSYDIPYDL